MLNVAVSLLLGGNKKSETTLKAAHHFFENFLKEAKRLYGKEILVYNLHSLLHLSQEARIYGNLDECSAFIFESFMQVIKRSVRSGSHVLAQIVRRMKEKSHLPIECTETTFVVKLVRPNNSFVLRNGSFCEIIGYEMDAQMQKKFQCHVFSNRETQPLFRTPCDSRTIGIGVCQQEEHVLKLIGMKDIDKVAIMVPNEEEREITFMSVLHEIPIQKWGTHRCTSYKITKCFF